MRRMEKMVDLEVRGAINVVEACAQTEKVVKVIFTSSLTAAIWRDNISYQKDVDEKSWSDHQFCRKLKLSEQAAWALAMDRMLRMVSIPDLFLALVPHNRTLAQLSYLNGAAQMYENGVLAFVDVNFLVDIHIRALEDESTSGRYLCFNQIVNAEDEAIKLAHSLSPLISLPPRYEYQGSEVHTERLRNEKLSKLV